MVGVMILNWVVLIWIGSFCYLECSLLGKMGLRSSLKLRFLAFGAGGGLDRIRIVLNPI